MHASATAALDPARPYPPRELALALALRFKLPLDALDALTERIATALSHGSLRRAPTRERLVPLDVVRDVLEARHALAKAIILGSIPDELPRVHGRDGRVRGERLTICDAYDAPDAHRTKPQSLERYRKRDALWTEIAAHVEPFDPITQRPTPDVIARIHSESEAKLQNAYRDKAPLRPFKRDPWPDPTIAVIPRPSRVRAERPLSAAFRARFLGSK